MAVTSDLYRIVNCKVNIGGEYTYIVKQLAQLFVCSARLVKSRCGGVFLRGRFIGPV